MWTEEQLADMGSAEISGIKNAMLFILLENARAAAPELNDREATKYLAASNQRMAELAEKLKNQGVL